MNSYISVRLSHVLRHCSVGSIVRSQDFLMTVKDIRKWTDRHGRPGGRLILYVDQVRSALGIDQDLREPPLARELDNGQVEGVCIPAMLFPSWMRCSKCGLLFYKPWKTRDPNKNVLNCICQPASPSTLNQTPWILVHSDGHMADVPWHYLVHKDAMSQKQHNCRSMPEKPYLRLSDTVSGSERKLLCTVCGANHLFRSGEHIPFKSSHCQPWIWEHTEFPVEPGMILEINDARVHSAITMNALVIPPESRIKKGTVVDRLYSSTSKRKRIETVRTELARQSIFRQMAMEFHCSEKDLKNAWQEIQNGYPLYGAQITPGILLEREYQALTDEIPDLSEDEDFVPRHHCKELKMLAGQLSESSRTLSAAQSLAQLISVTRLKEIQVFNGFQRLQGKTVPPDISGKSDWLPAMELYGEGIFFTIEEEYLQKWEEQNRHGQRIKQLQQRFIASGLRFNHDLAVTPRFLLMHTLAHILIKRLEAEAGYPAASIKERIYCATGKSPMSGILIYVAVPDIFGSLGGLSELAEPRRFIKLLRAAIDHARWCSLDPVCSEHEGQGPGLLNRAACHGCALIPDTSCIYGNVLLDRTMIKGDFSRDIPGFFESF